MLAMARILRTGARLLLLDEITEGLAPVIVQALGRVVRALKERGYTIILVEQNFRFVAPLADRHYVVERGRIVDMVDRATSSPHGMESLHGSSASEPARPERKCPHACDERPHLAALPSRSRSPCRRSARAAAQAKISDGVVKIGVLTDMTGYYSDLAGPGSRARRQDGGRRLRRRRCSASRSRSSPPTTSSRPTSPRNTARKWFDEEQGGRDRGPRLLLAPRSR